MAESAGPRWRSPETTTRDASRVPVIPYGDQYEYATFVRRITSVTEPALRRRQLERHLLTVDADTAAAHLQRLLRDGVRGSRAANEILLPLAEFVHQANEQHALALEAVNLAARSAELHGVGWYLLNPRPFQELDERVAKNMRAESMSLGHRKAAAGQGDRRLLERLVNDPHPMVIERLCRNPRIQEGHVLNIATRRPTTAALLETVALTPKWLRNPTVREALAQNPYIPTGVALRLLPTLRPKVLATMPHSSQLHDALKQFARYLLELRVSEPERPNPDLDNAATRPRGSSPRTVD